MKSTTITIKTPYDILEAPENIDFGQLRAVYRKHIHAFKQNKISPSNFRLICRAYETLSDHAKRKLYDTRKEWISELSVDKYTLQQLAAESDLLSILRNRLADASLREINAQDALTGHTPLYCAARAGNMGAVSYLTEQGAEPDLSQRTQSTALHVASFYGHGDVVRCLLESGANYCKTNAYDHTAEMEAYTTDVQKLFGELAKMPYVQAAANQLDWFQKHDGAWEHHIDEQFYVQRQTLLHCASKKGYFDLVRWLIEVRSANLDIVDVNLNSALHLASYGGHTDIVTYLLDCGSNSRLVNRWGMTAEQEGSSHDNRITDIFQQMRARDMFRMAREGKDWWFYYHFNGSVDAIDFKGTSLLYHACRYGQTSVAKWLLENGANVNVQLQTEARSTPLHGAAFYAHVSTVELLIAHGADVSIKNSYGLTVFEDTKSNEIKQLLVQYRRNLNSQKLIAVHVYADEDNSQEPLAKLQLHHSDTQNDLLELLPKTLRSKDGYFSIARRPLQFDKNNPSSVLSAVCCARYARTKLIEVPLRLTLHTTTPPQRQNSVLERMQSDFKMRTFTKDFHTNSKLSYLELHAPVIEKQTFRINALTFTFSTGCVKSDLTIEVKTHFAPDRQLYDLPECLCLFETQLYQDTPKLLEMPLMSFADEPNARLYTLATPSPFWYTFDTRQTRLPMIGGVHAFVRHIEIIPALLSLPADMLIAVNSGQPLIRRQTPVNCKCLAIRERNADMFPHIAYHGTSIGVVRSILADGLVIPGTVVANGKRISPPPNHIARGRQAFGVSDFADAVFLSPSVHYSSDSVYANSFEDDDQQLLPVLECSVKRNSFRVYQSTVPTYTAHPGDDLKAIEWRVEDPTNIEINAVLFIPKIDSIAEAARKRASKIGVDHDT